MARPPPARVTTERFLNHGRMHTDICNSPHGQGRRPSGRWNTRTTGRSARARPGPMATRGSSRTTSPRARTLRAPRAGGRASLLGRRGRPDRLRHDRQARDQGLGGQRARRHHPDGGSADHRRTDCRQGAFTSGVASAYSTVVASWVNVRPVSATPTPASSSTRPATTPAALPVPASCLTRCRSSPAAAS